MKQIKKHTGIIIKISDYTDEAVIADVLEEKGVFGYRIKGTTNPNSKTRCYATTLNRISFNATNDPVLGLMTEVNVDNYYPNIKFDLDKLNISSIILEKIRTFATYVKDKKLFYEFACDVFNLLENTKYNYAVLNIFEIKMLYLLGVQPTLNSCVKCGKKCEGFFVINEGGIVCRECLTGFYDLSINYSNLFRDIYYRKINNLDDSFLNRANTNALSRTIDAYYESYLDFKSKSKEIVRKMEQ